MWFSKKQPKKVEDRRDSNRVDAFDYFAVHFETDELVRSTGMGSGKNLSLGGIKFATFAPIKKGHSLDITICFSGRFPGRKEINVKAKVVRVFKPEGAERFRIACRFTHLETSKEQIETIRQFMDWMSSVPVTFSIPEYKAAV